MKLLRQLSKQLKRCVPLEATSSFFTINYVISVVRKPDHTEHIVHFTLTVVTTKQ